jgi:hypothetical protein
LIITRVSILCSLICSTLNDEKGRHTTAHTTAAKDIPEKTNNETGQNINKVYHSWGWLKHFEKKT